MRSVLGMISWLLMGPMLGLAPLSTVQASSAEALVPERHTVVTADGLALAVRRYANPGAQPVLFVHGLSANMNCFDTSVEGASMARFLARRGYDVWLFNERGMGEGEWQSDVEPDWNHSVDDIAVLDLPAVVEYVQQETGGLKLLAIGHSMGGMILSIYLEGGSYASGGGVGASLIRLDPALSRARNAQLAGAVIMSSPVRMDWEARPTIFNFLLYSYWDYNLLMTSLAGNDLALAAARALDVLPTDRVIALITQDLRDFPYIGDELSEFLTWVISYFGDSMLMSQIVNPKYMTPALTAAALEEVIDGMGGMVLEQFVDWVRHRTFREFHHAANAAPAVYADSFGMLTAPLLVVTGGKDKLASDGIIYEHGYKRYGSTDKKYLHFSERGHGDILLGTGVETQVFPPIHDWMLRHAATGTAAVR